MRIQQIFLLLLLCLINNFAFSKSAPWVGSDLKGNRCSGKVQGFGPFDYTNPKVNNPVIGGPLNLVERAHFTKEVEYLIKGHSGRLTGDIDYTLRAWPNHPRALLSIIRYQLKIKNKLIKARPLKTPPECYLQRAIEFSKKDPTAYSLYAYYLSKLNKYKQAEKHYQQALNISPNNPKLEYSYSLLLIKMKRNKEALKYAKLAYHHGNPPTGLKKKLIKLKIWSK